MLRKLISFIGVSFCTWAVMVVPVAASAQVTGPADAGRVEQRVREGPPSLKVVAPPAPPARSMGIAQPAPKGSEAIRLTLTSITLDGGKQLDESVTRAAYAEYLGKDISLATVWVIAGRLTALYQQAGYFLVLVQVPLQEISGGAVRLKVVEGCISELGLDSAARANPLANDILEQLLNQPSLHSQQFEQVLLQLNSLPGQNYRTVLELPKEPDAPEGAVRLSVVTLAQPPRAQVGIDNYGSRFLGPAGITQSYSVSPLPNQRTDITFLTTTEISELKYASIAHTIALARDWVMEVSGGLTDARPGDTLAVQEISSISRSAGIGAIYHWWTQRDTSLSTRMGLDIRDVRSKLLGSVLSQDRIRALRASINYMGYDAVGGNNRVNATVTRGLAALGASNAGDLNLTRAAAAPDFTKMELAVTHSQPLPLGLNMVGSFSGQAASGPLYSSEEFGYGGQNYGRAYDNSEITGDQGVAASIELQYVGLPMVHDAQITPYGFYDIGTVWNKDVGQEKPISASSAGIGLRATHASGVSGNLGLAFPLTRDIANPLNNREQGPRVMVQLGVSF